MSEAMIKRWNEIPLNRTEGPAASSSKRARARSHSPSNSDESEDNIPLASRSPSPAPLNQKEEDISVYDQYIRKPVREPVTVDTKISSTNKGFGMLAKMGWKEGQGLGVAGQGRTDPIPFLLKFDALGLGKLSQDARIIESTVSQRRGLDSERMIKETEEQRSQREEAVAAKEQIKSAVKDTLRAFFCADCEKQYSNVAQYDEHIRSYAHNHVVRNKEQQATARQLQAGEAALRKAKERKREEKEMRKLAAAAGIKLPNAVAPSPRIVPASQAVIKPTGTSGGFAPVDAPVKRGGWTAVSAAAEIPSGRSFGAVPVSSSSPSGFKKVGWNVVGSASNPVSVTPEPVGSKQSQTASKSSAGFTRGGWTTLETTASNDVEMVSPTAPSASIPPPELLSVPPPPPPQSLGFQPPPPPPDDALPPPPPPRDAPPPAPSHPVRGQSNFRPWGSNDRWQ